MTQFAYDKAQWPGTLEPMTQLREKVVLDKESPFRSFRLVTVFQQQKRQLRDKAWSTFVSCFSVYCLDLQLSLLTTRGLCTCSYLKYDVAGDVYG